MAEGVGDGSVRIFWASLSLRPDVCGTRVNGSHRDHIPSSSLSTTRAFFFCGRNDEEASDTGEAVVFSARQQTAYLSVPF